VFLVRPVSLSRRGFQGLISVCYGLRVRGEELSALSTTTSSFGGGTFRACLFQGHGLGLPLSTLTQARFGVSGCARLRRMLFVRGGCRLGGLPELFLTTWIFKD
ncbi:unnamed protein product, partial [Brassica rapa subsp. trilocularis]